MSSGGGCRTQQTTFRPRAKLCRILAARIKLTAACGQLTFLKVIFGWVGRLQRCFPEAKRVSRPISPGIHGPTQNTVPEMIRKTAIFRTGRAGIEEATPGSSELPDGGNRVQKAGSGRRFGWSLFVHELRLVCGKNCVRFSGRVLAGRRACFLSLTDNFSDVRVLFNCQFAAGAGLWLFGLNAPVGVRFDTLQVRRYCYIRGASDI